MPTPTVTRQATLLPHPLSREQTEELVRLHVYFNLAVGHYCREVRRVRTIAEYAGGVATDALEAIFASIFGAANPSEEARGFHSPLTSPESTGKGLKDQAVIADLRVQYARLAADPTLIQDRAFESEKIRRKGNHSKWMSLLIEGTPINDNIREQARVWVEKKLAEMNGGPAVILRDAGWLTPGHASRIRTFADVSGLPPFSSMELYAFCRAMSVLASNSTIRANRMEERARDLEAAEAKVASVKTAPWWKLVEAYEADRTIRIGLDSGHVPKEPYRVGLGSDLRGWGTIREAWLKLRADPATTSSTLLSTFNQLRDEAPERFGDHALIDWLAAPSQWLLWDGSHLPPEARMTRASDLIGDKARYNRDSVPKRNISLTLPDPVVHPLRVDLGSSAAAPVKLDIEQGVIKIKSVSPIRIWANRRLTSDKGSVRLLDGSGRAGTGLPAVLKGVGLSLSRKALRQVKNIALFTQKDPTAARYEEMVATLTDTLLKQAHSFHFTVAVTLDKPASRAPTTNKQVKITKKPFFPAFLLNSAVPEFVGMRVLGVDLGTQKTTLASTVLVDKKPSGLARQVGANLWVAVEKVWTLSIPEDKSPPNLPALRDILYKNGRLVGYQNRVAKDAEVGGRVRDSRSLDPSIPIGIAEQFGLPVDDVKDARGDRKKFLKAWDTLVVQAREELLRQLPASREVGSGGISLDHIEFLENFLRYERMFSTRGRRAEVEKFRGTFHLHLRAKIRRMKDDRAKKVAGAIIAEAVKLKADVVAVEDLDRFKSRSDRPKTENRKIAQWSHREVLGRLVFAAEPRGISIATVKPNYTNRLSALTGAPGIRVSRFQEAWREYTWWKKIASSFPNVKEGDIVPHRNGDMLLTVGATPPLVVRKNAAIGIAIRYWDYDPRPALLALTPHKKGLAVSTEVPMWNGCIFKKTGESTYAPTTTRVNLKDTEDNGSDSPATMKSTRILCDLTRHVFGGTWVEARPFWQEVERQVTLRCMS